MLEHVIDADEPGAGRGDASTPKDDDYYVPPMSAEALSGKDKVPSVKRFNRKMLFAIAIIATVVITLAFAMGLQAPKAKAPEPLATTSKPPVPNAAVNALPSSYSDSAPNLGDPRPGDIGAMSAAGLGGDGAVNANAQRQLTPIEQYAQQLELDRLRNEDRARSATVSFANAGGNETSANAHAAAGPVDTSQGLQERLLELAQRGTGASGNGTGAGSLNARDDANRQDEKAVFTETTRDADFQLHATLQQARSPYTLFAGTILPCVLTQGIDSDLPGQIGCMISQNVYDTVTGKHLLLPQGTKVIGTYDSRISYGQSRVLVVWTRLLRPDGSTLSLEGMPGTDLSGYAGLTGHVNNHYVRLLTGVVLGSVIGAAAQIAVGANSQNPSFSQLAMQGAGQNINEAGQQITRKNLNIQPTIEVPPGGRLNIFATKDLILPPWDE
jgi:type IV secretory pathway VirB10-like protein